jgi:DNA polymerase-4
VKYGDKTVCRAVAMGVGRRRFNPFNGMEVWKSVISRS